MILPLLYSMWRERSLLGTVQCKFHLWIFDIKKECAAANEAIKLKSFPIVIREGEIFLDI